MPGPTLGSPAHALAGKQVRTHTCSCAGWALGGSWVGPGGSCMDPNTPLGLVWWILHGSWACPAMDLNTPLGLSWWILVVGFIVVASCGHLLCGYSEDLLEE